VDISEVVKIDENEYQKFEQPVSQLVLGNPADLDTIWVTVHGRVTDSVTHYPVSGVKVRLTDSGETVITNPNGEYKASFKHRGFENVEITLNIVLAPRCLTIGPRVASFGTVALGTVPGKEIKVENTCPDKIVDVTFSERNQAFHLRLENCGSSHQLGVAHDSTTGHMTMGPGSWCKLQLTFKPASHGSWDEELWFNGSDVPGVPVKLRALATASDTVLLDQTDGHVQPATKVGLTGLKVITITNGSPNSPLDIRGLKFGGANAAEFRVTVLSAQNNAIPSGATQLLPGEQCRVVVTFMPKAIGEYEATLVIDTSDPDVGAVRVPVSGLGSP